MSLLEGYKTYIAGFLLVLGAAGAYAAGDVEKAFELVSLALAVVGIRHAVGRK